MGLKWWVPAVYNIVYITLYVFIYQIYIYIYIQMSNLMKWELLILCMIVLCKTT